MVSFHAANATPRSPTAAATTNSLGLRELAAPVASVEEEGAPLEVPELPEGFELPAGFEMPEVVELLDGFEADDAPLGTEVAAGPAGHRSVEAYVVHLEDAGILVSPIATGSWSSPSHARNTPSWYAAGTLTSHPTVSRVCRQMPAAFGALLSQNFMQNCCEPMNLHGVSTAHIHTHSLSGRTGATRGSA